MCVGSANMALGQHNPWSLPNEVKCLDFFFFKEDLLDERDIRVLEELPW